MGGFGSGRYGGMPVIEDGLQMDINKLRRDRLIGPGIYRSGSLEWSETSTGRKVSSIRYEARINEEEGSLRLHYTTTRHVTGEKIRSDYTIRLEAVPQPFGGRRWYFVCPHLGVRVSKLYLPPGSTRFLSRGAYRHLAYRSQRTTPYDRALDIAFKLRRRMGDQGAIGDYIDKPKWMRWSTFERQLQRIKRAEAVIDAHIAGFLQQLRRRA
jgi:hypothetical protein